MRTSSVIGADLGLVGRTFNGEFCRDSGRKFDVKNLSPDLRRVCNRLTEMYDEEYALTMAFTIRTAVELHRAWNLSTATSNVIQQLKEEFELRLSWDEGVIDLSFRIEDGLYELYRRVPYDYDSEYQDMYMKTAVALVEGHICVHDALIFQTELKEGKHTARGLLLLRNHPGRLLLYPFQAATCCVIFFGGDWRDASISALCGIAAGLIDWALASSRLFPNTHESQKLLDVLVGVSTGVIGGLFHKFSADDEKVCLTAVFLGTLYWFFYGTAFVVGFFEIMVGEYQTGVTRFLAVSVKTFVLSIGSAAGLTMVLGDNVYSVWIRQSSANNGICKSIDLELQWWRIPLYLLCCISVLGQYRFVITNYWAGLLVQLVAYEAQYELFRNAPEDSFKYDGMDTVFKSVLGCASAVFTATLIAFVADYLSYQTRLDVGGLRNEDQKISMCSKFTQATYEVAVHTGSCLGITRNLPKRCAKIRKKFLEESEKQNKPVGDIKLSNEDEATLVEAAIEAQEFNVWSLLMPAVYQLVPGSQIALYWYNIIFPRQRFEDQDVEPFVEPIYNETGDDDLWSELPEDEKSIEKTVDTAEYALWLNSASLALGLILGFASVQFFSSVVRTLLLPFQNRFKSDDEIRKIKRALVRQDGRRGRFTHISKDHDPVDDSSRFPNDFETEKRNGLRKRIIGTPDV